VPIIPDESLICADSFCNAFCCASVKAVGIHSVGAHRYSRQPAGEQERWQKGETAGRTTTTSQPHGTTRRI
jgi:hypothetical protein